MGTSHGVPKLGIAEEPLEQILDSLEKVEGDDGRTVYSNPLGLDCPQCGETFHRLIVSDAAWTTVGASKPLEIHVGDTPDGRIVFAHVLETQ